MDEYLRPPTCILIFWDTLVRPVQVIFISLFEADHVTSTLHRRGDFTCLSLHRVAPRPASNRPDLLFSPLHVPHTLPNAALRNLEGLSVQVNTFVGSKFFGGRLCPLWHQFLGMVPPWSLPGHMQASWDRTSLPYHASGGWLCSSFSTRPITPATRA
eukprot:TRINITY_DN7738_c1_g1_i1.p1 TRINITY_DN7738_c1_g1~~TRINITY_DN7738_c1_g1_i1.p1  ORF type:complete len:157 (-),score=14.66 TRINITY_DN7738_c1_g1_i1:111-581(-)